jgi:hypothetical protein
VRIFQGEVLASVSVLRCNMPNDVRALVIGPSVENKVLGERSSSLGGVNGLSGSVLGRVWNAGRCAGVRRWNADCVVWCSVACRVQLGRAVGRTAETAGLGGLGVGYGVSMS